MTLTAENIKRYEEIARGYLKKSKAKGDVMWQKANQMLGYGDYDPSDDADAPAGLKE